MKLLTTGPAYTNREEKKILTIWSTRRITRLIIMVSRRSLNLMGRCQGGLRVFMLNLWAYDTMRERERTREAENHAQKWPGCYMDTCFVESMKSRIHSPEVRPSFSRQDFATEARSVIDFVLALEGISRKFTSSWSDEFFPPCSFFLSRL